MLTRGHRLAGELSTEPAVLLGEDDPTAGAHGSQRGGDPAGTAAHNQDLGFPFRQRPSCHDANPTIPRAGLTRRNSKPGRQLCPWTLGNLQSDTA